MMEVVEVKRILPAAAAGLVHNNAWVGHKGASSVALLVVHTHIQEMEYREYRGWETGEVYLVQETFEGHRVEEGVVVAWYWIPSCPYHLKDDKQSVQQAWLEYSRQKRKWMFPKAALQERE